MDRSAERSQVPVTARSGAINRLSPMVPERGR